MNGGSASVLNPEVMKEVRESEWSRFKGVGAYAPNCNHLGSRNSDLSRIVTVIQITRVFQENSYDGFSIQEIAWLGCDVAIDYVEGDYRQLMIANGLEYRIEPRLNSEGFKWYDTTRLSIFLALLAGRAEVAIAFTTWLPSDINIPFDPGADDVSETDNYLLLSELDLLAGIDSGESGREGVISGYSSGTSRTALHANA